MDRQKVVVTGATGHIGSQVAKLLLSMGYDVTILVRRETKTAVELKGLGAHVVVCDLLDAATFSPALGKAGALFHLAAQNALGSDSSLSNEILKLTQSVVGAAISAGIPKIVYTSSVVVLGRSPDPSVLVTVDDLVERPESPDVEGKLLAEKWIRDRVAGSVDIRTVYPSWVVGAGDPGRTPPHKFIRDFAIKGQPFYFGGGISIADVRDVAMGHIQALECEEAGGRYILSGENVTFQQFYNILAEQYGKASPRLKLPKFAIWIAAKVLGKLSPISASYVEAVIDRYSWYDASKLSSVIGYSARPVRETLASVKPDILSSIIGTDKIECRNTLAEFAGGSLLLITGFPGWLGNRAIDILINGDEKGRYKSDRPVRLLVLPSLLDALPKLPANFEVVVGDVGDKDCLDAVTKGISTVWHFAGVIYPDRLSDFDRVNHQGTVNLADACVRNGVSRFLFMSTDSCCGYSDGRVFSATEADKPYSDYGRSKLAAEKYILDLSRRGTIKATSLRGFWFFGPNPPPRNMGFLNSFKLPFQPMFGNGKNLRSISHCDDIVSAFVLAEKSDAAVSRWYWLPTTTLTVNEIYDLVAESIGKKSKPLRVPNFVCSMMAWTDRILVTRFGFLQPTIYAAGKFHRTIATDKSGWQPAERDFGWEPSVTKKQIQSEILAAIS